MRWFARRKGRGIVETLNLYISRAQCQPCGQQCRRIPSSKTVLVLPEPKVSCAGTAERAADEAEQLLRGECSEAPLRAVPALRWCFWAAVLVVVAVVCFAVGPAPRGAGLRPESARVTQAYELQNASQASLKGLKGLGLGGVSLGGWLCLEDWFFSMGKGRLVSSAHEQGQGYALPPRIPLMNSPWTSEGLLTRQLINEHGQAYAVQAISEYRTHFVTPEVEPTTPPDKLNRFGLWERRDMGESRDEAASQGSFVSEVQGADGAEPADFAASNPSAAGDDRHSVDCAGAGKDTAPRGSVSAKADNDASKRWKSGAIPTAPVFDGDVEGDAELELEEVEDSRYDCEGGTIREYESIGRLQSESVNAFIRFRLLERKMQESKERATAQILLAAGNKYEMKGVLDALRVHYPTVSREVKLCSFFLFVIGYVIRFYCIEDDYDAVAEGEYLDMVPENPDEDLHDNPLEDCEYEAEADNQADHPDVDADEAPEQDEGADENNTEGPSDDVQALLSAAQALTVTSKRLAGLVQARGFYQAGKSNFAGSPKGSKGRGKGGESKGKGVSGKGGGHVFPGGKFKGKTDNGKGAKVSTSLHRSRLKGCLCLGCGSPDHWIKGCPSFNVHNAQVSTAGIELDAEGNVVAECWMVSAEPGEEKIVRLPALSPEDASSSDFAQLQDLALEYIGCSDKMNRNPSILLNYHNFQNAAFMIADTGCQRQVAGQAWRTQKALEVKPLQAIALDDSCHFSFGPGRPLRSQGRFVYPVDIGSELLTPLVRCLMPSPTWLISWRNMMARLLEFVTSVQQAVLFCSVISLKPALRDAVLRTHMVPSTAATMLSTSAAMAAKKALNLDRCTKDPHREGCHFLIENPAGTPFWDHPALRRLRSVPGVTLQTGHMCRFGLKDNNGLLLKKPTSWLSDLPEVLIELGGLAVRMRSTLRIYARQLLMGWRSPWLPMVTSFCSNYAQAGEDSAAEVLFVDVNRRTDAWKPLLQEAEECLRGKAALSAIVKAATPLFEKIRTLVPRTKQTEELDAADALQPYQAGCRDITFPGLDREKLWFVTWFMQVCRRVAPPRAARPIKPFVPRRFNDRLSLDSLFLKDIRGAMYAYLNQVDTATSYQALAYIANRTEGEVLKVLLVNGWFSFFGYPDQLLLDAEGAFKGYPFESLQAQCGVKLVYIPADAHRQLGHAERHGQAIRYVVRALVSQFAPTSTPEMNLVVSMTTMAKNSLMRRSGSTPSQWVFGSPSSPAGGPPFNRRWQWHNTFVSNTTPPSARLSYGKAVLFVVLLRGLWKDIDKEWWLPLMEEWWQPGQQDLDLLKNFEEDLPRHPLAFRADVGVCGAAPAAEPEPADVPLDARGQPILEPSPPLMLEPLMLVPPTPRTIPSTPRLLPGTPGGGRGAPAPLALPPVPEDRSLVHEPAPAAQDLPPVPKQSSATSAQDLAPVPEQSSASSALLPTRGESVSRPVPTRGESVSREPCTQGESVSRQVTSERRSSGGLTSELERLMVSEYPDHRGTKRQASSTPEEVQLQDALLRSMRPPFSDAALRDDELQVGGDGKVQERQAFDAILPPGLNKYPLDDLAPPVETPPPLQAQTLKVDVRDLSPTRRLDVLRRHARGSQFQGGWDGTPHELQPIFERHSFLTAAHVCGNHEDRPGVTEGLGDDHVSCFATTSTTSTSERLAAQLLKHKVCLTTTPDSSSWHEKLTRYITSYLKYHGLSGPTTSVSISRNVRALPRRDCHNAKSSMHYHVTFGEYVGGRLWVQADGSEAVGPDGVVWRKMNGKPVAGYYHDAHQQILEFSPSDLHETEKFAGDRWSITAYIYHEAYRLTATTEASEQIATETSGDKGDDRGHVHEATCAKKQALKKELPWKAMTPEVKPGEVDRSLILKSRLCYRWKPNAEEVSLWNGDCKSASLQGRPDDERPTPIFMAPPKDPVALEAIPEWNDPALLYKLSAPVYGQSNAPRRLKWARHAGVLDDVHSKFEWRSPWVSRDFKFVGRHIKQKDDGTITIDQEGYVAEVPLTKTKLDPSTPLKDYSDLVTEYRSGIGSLQWLAGTTRGDISVDVSLYVRATQDSVVRMHPVNLTNLLFICYGDSGWGNACGGKSQGGQHLVSSDDSVYTEPRPGSIFEWKSYRHQRVLRSTLAAEACALDRAQDYGNYLALMFSEMTDGSFIATHNQRWTSLDYESHAEDFDGQFLANPVVTLTDARAAEDMFTGDALFVRGSNHGMGLSMLKRRLERFDCEVRLPITWAAFADALGPLDQAVYASHNADLDIITVPDPFYKDNASLVTIPRKLLTDFLHEARAHGLSVILDVHAYPGGASHGTYNGVWPLKCAFWTEKSRIGSTSLTQIGLWIVDKLVHWIENMDLEAQGTIAGVTLMNEPGHMNRWKQFAPDQAILSWLGEASARFLSSRLPVGLKLYVSLVETAFQDFGGLAVPWYQQAFTLEERRTRVVADVHYYMAWNHGNCDGRSDGLGAYSCGADPATYAGTLIRRDV
ncbi:GIP [Symbiodinium necroappetens]|uniref:GIP protein n=1 Tax=Symbiodinium necroappetens TaxID=1628268 RepID=A0A812YZS8_9DINO|nr:GIP [Symbiodinium necroappetens]